MFGSMLRFWLQGWITSVYVSPKFHFTYQGFEWVRPLGHTGMHVLFLCLTLAALAIALGLFYRVATVVFFLGFTYVELIDVTTYLNHYYYISLVAFLMIWLPANRDYSGDVRLRPGTRRRQVPLWCIGILRFQMAVVYVFAGLAKLNPDWLLEALPLRIWLPAKSHLPIVGPLMHEAWVAYVFSWFGAAYDLFIAFFLLHRSTRPVAYCFVILFHAATAIFFPGIGMFPYVMMAGSLIFFSAGFHERLLSLLPGYSASRFAHTTDRFRYRIGNRKLIMIALGAYCLVQLIIPLRFLLYPGRLFWHEEGYRFSWRVMLMEKSGAAYFRVRDAVDGRSAEVNNAEFLTPMQEKMMSTQPDMILKYAHFLARTFRDRGFSRPEVYGEVYVSLNGERSRLFIDSSVNLASQPLSWGHYQWVLPYEKTADRR